MILFFQNVTEYLLQITFEDMEEPITLKRLCGTSHSIVSQGEIVLRTKRLQRADMQSSCFFFSKEISNACTHELSCFVGLQVIRIQGQEPHGCDISHLLLQGSAHISIAKSNLLVIG